MFRGLTIDSHPSNGDRYQRGGCMVGRLSIVCQRVEVESVARPVGLTVDQRTGDYNLLRVSYEHTAVQRSNSVIEWKPVYWSSTHHIAADRGQSYCQRVRAIPVPFSRPRRAGGQSDSVHRRCRGTEPRQ